MNLNEDFIAQINSLLPSDEASAMLQAIKSSEPVISVRFNDSKGFLPPASLERVPWCETGAYLSQRPQFTFDPHFHAGSYYVQDASSMFIYHAIKSLVNKPVTYLDLCAAPGGKTTAALQALPKGSIVVANEIVAARAQVLRENIIKWGNDNCMVTNDSPRALGTLENAFDVIAADVPCSGEGMFRKDDEAVAQWSPQLVKQCAARQREILADIWPALKPGGLLIYSTCTYNLDENEHIAQYIANELGATFVEIPVEKSWNITGDLSCNAQGTKLELGIGDRGSGIVHSHHSPLTSHLSPQPSNSIPCYRFLPHRTRGEGLFLCVLKKMHKAQCLNWGSGIGDRRSGIGTLHYELLTLNCELKTLPSQLSPLNTHLSPLTSHQKLQFSCSKIPKEVSSWIEGDYELTENNGIIFAINKDIKEVIDNNNNKLHVIKGLGFEVGTTKGNKIVPSHQLAMSPRLNDDAFVKCEVDYATAISYLRGQAITINAPRGFVLITCQNAKLGFVNNLGNRANNLYPKRWRILSSHTPQEPVSLID